MLPLIGLAHAAWVLGTVLIAGGLGGAAFHPPAAALVHKYAGHHRGFAMSFHITSGTLGQAMAPLLFAPFVQRYGLRATPWLAVPGLAVLAGVLLRRVPPLARTAEDQRERRPRRALHGVRGERVGGDQLEGERPAGAELELELLADVGVEVVLGQAVEVLHALSSGRCRTAPADRGAGPGGGDCRRFGGGGQERRGCGAIAVYSGNG